MFDELAAFVLVGEASSTLLISVADDANDVINDLKSVFATAMLVLLKKFCVGDFTAADAFGVNGTGFSEARRIDPDGVGAPIKSE